MIPLLEHTVHFAKMPSSRKVRGKHAPLSINFHLTTFSQAPNQRVQRVQVHPLFFWSRSLVVLNKSRILLNKSRIRDLFSKVRDCTPTFSARLAPMDILYILLFDILIVHGRSKSLEKLKLAQTESSKFSTYQLLT